MCFKYAFIYEGDLFGTMQPDLIQQSVNAALEQHPFTELTAMQEETDGWVAPFGTHQLCELVHGRLYMTLQFQQKILPASVINEAMLKKAAEIEAQEGRRPGRKEREQLKEDIRAEKLPQAFHKTSKVSLFYDIARKLLVVNASSEKKADTVTAYLREAIGSLPIIPFVKSASGADVLTTWYLDPNTRPSMTTLESPVYLTMVQDPTVKSSHRNLDLHAPEIQQAIDSGMRVKKVGINVDGEISGTIDEKFVLRTLRYSDALVEKGNESDDPRTDAMLMSDSLVSLIESIRKVAFSDPDGDTHLQEPLI